MAPPPPYSLCVCVYTEDFIIFSSLLIQAHLIADNMSDGLPSVPGLALAQPRPLV